MIYVDKRTNEKAKETFLQLAAAFFILLFLYTAFSKLTGLEKFKAFLTISPILSPYSSVIVWLIPSAEIIVSALLFLPNTRKHGLLATTLLMSVFTLYIAYMVMYRHLPCSCGGIIQRLSWPQHLFLNIFLLLLSIISLWLEYNPNLFIAINRSRRKPV